MEKIIDNMKKKPAYCFFKRVFDIIASTLVLLILFPFLLVIALIIKIDSKGPIFFKQKRIGQHKCFFYILKFRSMYVDTPSDSPTHQLADAKTHITKVGKFIRKASIDELPQLLNILSGKMTFVGPRPALWNQEDLVLERDKYFANDVKPGLTGLAQISGRDELEISLKAKIDGDYVSKRSFFYDIYIIILTIFKTLQHDGIVEGNADKIVSKNKKE